MERRQNPYIKKLIYEQLQTKRKLTYRTCTIFRVFQANERQSGHCLGATGKVAYVASVSICFRSKEEEQDSHHQKNGTRCKRGRGRGRKEVSFCSFTRVIFGALFHARSSLFSPKQHGNACHASYRSGEKMTLFFFLLFAPPLGRTLSPAFARLNIQKKKEQTNKRQAHSKNVGTELELSLIPFRFPVCFTINIISLTHPPITKKNAKIINIMRPFYLYADKKYKTSDITKKEDIPELAEVLGLPETFTYSQGSMTNGIEGPCIMLKRFSYPCRYSDLIPHFGHAVPVMSMICNTVVDFVYNLHGQRITEYNHNLLDSASLQVYAD